MSNADGIFGPATEAYIVQWQATHGLNPDGICGKKTWAAILSEPATKLPMKGVIYKPINLHINKKVNREIKYLAIHFTAGSTSKKGKALDTRDVFLTRAASADFIVDDADIVQVNPDPRNYYCWAVGDTKSSANGGAMYRDATNKNTISIEICSTLAKGASVNVSNHDGWSFTKEAVDNAIALTRFLMKEYRIPLDRVVRHYDISGKLCPGIIGYNNGPLYDSKSGRLIGKNNNSSLWIAFKNRLK